MKKIKAAVRMTIALTLVVWLCIKTNDELGGLGPFMMFGVLVYGFEAFKAFNATKQEHTPS